MNSSDVFTNLVPQFRPRIFLVCAVEKERKFLIGPNNFFFLSLSVEKVIITKLADSELKIGGTIWWAYQSTFFEIIHNSRKALGDGTADQKWLIQIGAMVNQTIRSTLKIVYTCLEVVMPENGTIVNAH